METGQYEIDTEMLGYWILGLSAVLVVSGLYVSDFSPDFLSGEDEENKLEVEFENRPLEPNELTTLTVSLDGERVQGATVRLDNLNVGETNRNGKLMFRGLENDFPVNVSYEDYYRVDEINVEEDASETREASDDDSNQDDLNDGSQDSNDSQDSGDSNEDSQGSDDSNDSQDSNDDSDNQQEFTGFRLDSDPVAEETNRLTLFENGERLGNQQVQLNGDKLGETTTGGGLTFQVPNVQEMTLQASNIEQSFQVEGYEDRRTGASGDITPVIDKSGQDYVGETVTFDASDTESQNQIETYRWTVTVNDSTETFTGEILEYEVKQTGVHDVDLEVEDIEGFTETDTSFIDAKPEYEGPDIIMNRPRNGDDVGPGEEFEFQIDNARKGQEAQIQVGGQTLETVELQEGLNIFENEESVFVEFREAGNRDYNIQVIEQGQNWSSDSWTIDIERAWNNYGSFQAESPEDGVTVENNATFEFSLDLKDDVELQIQGEENTDSQEQQTFDYSTMVSEDRNSISDTLDIEPGEYNWTAEIRPQSTSEDPKSTDERTLTVE